MKPVGIFYATREGQTRRIAERMASNFRARGMKAETRNVVDRPGSIDLDRFGFALLAASVHAGSHEREMIAFIKKHRDQLEGMPNAFISVTLSEAGVERVNAMPEERARFAADVEKVMDTFYKQTGWHPQRVKPVAGAILYTKYNFLIRFIMKWIASNAGAETDTSRDYEYTDWLALDHFADEIFREIAAA